LWGGRGKKEKTKMNKGSIQEMALPDSTNWLKGEAVRRKSVHDKAREKKKVAAREHFVPGKWRTDSSLGTGGQTGVFKRGGL